MKFDRLRFIIGIVLAAATFLLCVHFTGSVKAAAVIAVLFIVAGAVCFDSEKTEGKKGIILNAGWMIAASVAAGFLSQLALNESYLSLGSKRLFLETVICLGVILFFYVFTSNMKASVCTAVPLLVIFTVINYYVYLFRGSEIQPADILSIQTAGNVAAEYTVKITSTVFYSLALTVLFVFLTTGFPRTIKKRRVLPRMLSILVIALIIGAYIPVSSTVKPLHYLQTGSVANGYLLNFVLQLRETFVQKPNGYSTDTAKTILEEYNVSAESDERRPDIIVIMDESYADLSILGSELQTNKEVSPFIKSLKENTVKGYALCSVFGGGTPNSEYEFLSGNTMMFLPPGSIVYQQYIKQPTYSMVSELNERGYQTIAMHPYLSSGWARTTVYPLLGFEESYFLDDFPQERLIRNYVSDQEMFETLTKVYEEKTENSEDPVFIFGVTMQNHGGYDYEGDNFSREIELSGYSKKYPDAEQYLSLIHDTDKAVEWLIRYYEQCERDAVIVFFGDHLPNLDHRFYEEIHGGPFETLEEQQLEYTVPFFIWTNYDSVERETGLISLNYLSEYMYKDAELTLPAYIRFLQDVQKRVTAMNANGYYTTGINEFKHESGSGIGSEQGVLQQYKMIEYYQLFGSQK